MQCRKCRKPLSPDSESRYCSKCESGITGSWMDRSSALADIGQAAKDRSVRRSPRGAFLDEGSSLEVLEEGGGAMQDSIAKRRKDLEIGFASYSNPRQPDSAPFLTMCQLFVKQQPMLLLRADETLNFMRFREIPTEGFQEIAGKTLEQYQVLANGLVVRSPADAVKHQNPISTQRVIKIVHDNWKHFLEPYQWASAVFRKLQALILTVLIDEETSEVKQIPNNRLMLPHEVPGKQR